MAEKSKLTVAAEIATIAGVVITAIGTRIGWMAYRDAHPATVQGIANYSGAFMTIKAPASYWFMGALSLSIAASLLFFMASRNRQDNSRSLEKYKADLHDSAKRNLEYRGKIEELCSDAVSNSDPLVYVQFIDDRSNGSDKIELQAYFALVNRSESEARNIILDPIEMKGNLVQFTRQKLAAPLLPKREAYFYPDVVTKDNKSVRDLDRNLFHAFCMDYIALGDSSICEAVKQVRATYQDSRQNLFEVACELVFDPSAHNDVTVGNGRSNPVIFTRSHKFRKIATAI